jgi:hypothetical protein
MSRFGGWVKKDGGFPCEGYRNGVGQSRLQALGIGEELGREILPVITNVFSMICDIWTGFQYFRHAAFRGLPIQSCICWLDFCLFRSCECIDTLLVSTKQTIRRFTVEIHVGIRCHVCGRTRLSPCVCR